MTKKQSLCIFGFWNVYDHHSFTGQCFDSRTLKFACYIGRRKWRLFLSVLHITHRKSQEARICEVFQFSSRTWKIMKISMILIIFISLFFKSAFTENQFVSNLTCSFDREHDLQNGCWKCRILFNSNSIQLCDVYSGP